MEQMAEAGRTLQEARRARALSIADVSAETGIPAHFLEAIEAERFEAIPAPVYVRGFVRLYAQSLGLEAESVVRQLGPRWQPPGGLPIPPAGTAPPAIEQGRPEIEGVATPPGLADAAADVEASASPVSPPMPPGPVPASVPAPPASATGSQGGAPGLLDGEPVIGGSHSDLPAHDGAEHAAPSLTTEDEIASPSSPVAPPPMLIDDLEPLAADDAEPLSHRRGTGLDGAKKRPLVALAVGVVVALGALAAFTFLWPGGGDARPVEAEGGAAATQTAAASATEQAAAIVLTPTATPSPTPTLTPTPSPTATPTPPPTPTVIPTPTAVPLVMPEVPSNPFAYCTNVSGDTYECGPGPWRVICTPSGPFLDAKGLVPRPVPAAWEGWREATISGRLENLFSAC